MSGTALITRPSTLDDVSIPRASMSQRPSSPRRRTESGGTGRRNASTRTSAPWSRAASAWRWAHTPWTGSNCDGYHSATTATRTRSILVRRPQDRRGEGLDVLHEVMLAVHGPAAGRQPGTQPGVVADP